MMKRKHDIYFFFFALLPDTTSWWASNYDQSTPDYTGRTFGLRNQMHTEDVTFIIRAAKAEPVILLNYYFHFCNIFLFFFFFFLSLIPIFFSRIL